VQLLWFELEQKHMIFEKIRQASQKYRGHALAALVLFAVVSWYATPPYILSHYPALAAFTLFMAKIVPGLGIKGVRFDLISAPTNIGTHVVPRSAPMANFPALTAEKPLPPTALAY
jgi:thiamine pyrophosphokinase